MARSRPQADTPLITACLRWHVIKVGLPLCLQFEEVLTEVFLACYDREPDSGTLGPGTLHRWPPCWLQIPDSATPRWRWPFMPAQ